MRDDAKVHRGNGDGLLEGDRREVAALEMQVEREVEVGAGVPHMVTTSIRTRFPARSARESSRASSSRNVPCISTDTRP